MLGVMGSPSGEEQTADRPEGAWRERKDMRRSATKAVAKRPKPPRKKIKPGSATKAKRASPNKAHRTPSTKAKQIGSKKAKRTAPKRSTRTSPKIKPTSVAAMQAQIDLPPEKWTPVYAAFASACSGVM